MRRITVSRTIDASASAAWDILVDVERWPSWGTSIRSADVDGDGTRIGPGASGSVTTIVGVTLPFRISDWVDGSHWRWQVAGLPATGHTVDTVSAERCRVSMDVPWFAAPYAVVLQRALANIDRALMATGESG